MTGFFGILKDISMLADDTTLAIKHTASILSDDIAVSSEQSSTFRASRELPSVWAITKGSFLNKLIILPVMFLLTAFLPSAINPILILGGIYLSYEGFEKVYEYLFVKEDEQKEVKELSEDDILKVEKTKIKSAIITDFILSIEIVLIALSSVVGKSLSEQILIVTFVSYLATVGVYGLVALIIRLDDIGIWFIKKKVIGVGKFMIKLMSFLIIALGYIGTVAMLLVAGGIFVHKITLLHETFIHYNLFLSILIEMFISFIVGAIAFYSLKLGKSL